MQKTTSRFVSASLTTIAFLVTNSPVFANLNVSNAFTLFDQRRYQEARIAFESDIKSTWKDLGAAYTYAETLMMLGKKSDAIKVCKRIVREDPQSAWAFASKESLKEWTGNTSSQSDIGIIGLKFTIRDGESAKVERIFPHTPAKSQLQEGDVLVAVNGVPSKGLTKAEIFRMISGSPGATVKLTILKDDGTFEKTLTRMSLKALASSHPDIWRMYLSQQEVFPDGAEPRDRP